VPGASRMGPTNPSRYYNPRAASAPPTQAPMTPAVPPTDTTKKPERKP
jgi:hypothetical protein